MIAFNLSAELVYTNVLNLIDLAGLPVRSAERGAGHPLVVAGGHCAFNPEPLADFVDCFVLGDGEEVVGEINEVVASFGGRVAGARGVPAACPGPSARRVRALVLRGPLPLGSRLGLQPRRRWPSRDHRWAGDDGTVRRRDPHGSPRPRTGSRSGPSPTWPSGPIPAASWCPSSRWSTTASTSRSSGDAPGAAASARPG